MIGGSKKGALQGMFDLSGKVAIVSGASRGIGEQIARTYAAAGARVVISSRRSENIEPVAESINSEYPGMALAVVAHAGEEENGRALVERAVETFGRVDIAVNNAGTNPHFGPLLSSEESQWDKIFEVNVKGSFWLCKAAALQMREQGEGGKIINMSSVAGIKPGYFMGIYSISKAALIMMTKSLAVELAPDNIQVNAIAPGFFRTRFSAAVWGNEQLYQAVLERTPAGRFGDTDELSGIALYLASAASSYTTGSVFTIDGGSLLT
jgi:NAD(P)-dependent dehydrogenase (short-subunit alcohol dehydrogenase family)